MKARMIYRFSLALLTGLLFLPGTLQAQTEDQIEQFQEERRRFFEENLELTPEEANDFWPLYNDFSNRKMKLMEAERNNFRYARQNEGNISAEETEEILGKILDSKRAILKLDEEFYEKKFPKVLSPEKILKLYHVEWDYRRHLLREIRGGGHGPGGPGDGLGPPPDGRGRNKK